MRERHEQLAAALKDLDDVLCCEYVLEHPQPETVVGRVEDETDQNVEVIYYDDHILLQENGHDGKDRTAFVWAEDPKGWTTVVRNTVIDWFASI